MGSFSSEFLLLEGTKLIICLTFNVTLFFSSLSMSAFHCVPKLNSENIYKEGRDLQAKFSHFTTNSGHSSVHHQLKRRYFLKNTNVWSSAFKEYFVIQQAFYLQYQMYPTYVNIPVTVSQTSTYDGTTTQQCPNQILRDEFQNSKLHVSTPTI